MIARTEALVLRIHPFAETSRIVVWLTPDHGRLVTAVKGSCRPKSPFAGQYDLFQTCELLYYARDHDGVHVAKECAPLDTRPRLRTDWRAFACASYAAGLVASIGVAGGHQHELYAHMTALLDSLCADGALTRVLIWFELRLARLLGLGPRLKHCAACGGHIPPGEAAWFAWARGGVLCPACADVEDGHAAHLGPDILAILRRWEGAATPAAARNTRCSPKQLLVLRENIGTFLQYHLDLAPVGRGIALEMMATEKL